jgi:hypothetical protein
MDYRLDYITRLFQKISKKRLETYVITRIWHILDNEDIKIVPQQYVKRDDGKYALTDLYLPQLNLHIEVNEDAHYFCEDKINRDLRRRKEVEINSKQEIIEIDCRGSLTGLNKRIDECIKTILNRIEHQKQNNLFKPWETDLTFTVEYHKNKKVLDSNDNPCLRTVDDICALFEATVPKRGFLRKGGVLHPNNNDLLIWWPSYGNNHFSNTISKDENEIVEYSNNEYKRNEHILAVYDHPLKRATFFRDTDALGFTFYRFKGIYDLDLAKTNIQNGLVWKRVEKTLGI